MADVLITGDLRYHDADRAADLGMALIVVPHDHLETWALRRWTPHPARGPQPLGGGRPYSDERPVRPGVAPMRSANKNGPDLRRRGPSRPALRPGRRGRGQRPPRRGHRGGRPAQERSGGGPSLYLLRVDGGSRGNPGPSAIGVVLEDEQGNVVEEIGARIGHATNNVAEYQALITGSGDGCSTGECGACASSPTHCSWCASCARSSRSRTSGLQRALLPGSVAGAASSTRWRSRTCRARRTPPPTRWSTRRWTARSVVSPWARAWIRPPLVLGAASVCIPERELGYNPSPPGVDWRGRRFGPGGCSSVG